MPDFFSRLVNEENLFSLVAGRNLSAFPVRGAGCSVHHAESCTHSLITTKHQKILILTFKLEIKVSKWSVNLREVNLRVVSLAAGISLESCREGGKESELSQPLAKQPAVHLCKCVLAILIKALLAEPAQTAQGYGSSSLIC